MEIRQAIKAKNLRQYEIATALNVTPGTFCHWLLTELPEAKKNKVLEVIESL